MPKPTLPAGGSSVSERLFDHDPISGMTTWHSYDEETDTTFFRYEQDTSAILDHNKEMQAEGFDKRSDMWHAAKIPNVIIMEWLTKHGVRFWDKNHTEGVKRLLNSDEYRHLRTNHFII